MNSEHLNEMNGVSYYPINPIQELEMMLYSSFLGEKTFYNPATDKDIEIQNFDIIFNNLKDNLIFPDHGKKSRQRIFYETVNKALDYDFKETLKLASKARNEFLMRKSACELIAIAAAHPNRVNFNKKNPMFFRNIVNEVCNLPTDRISILDSWKNLKGSKSQFPSFLDRAFASDLVKLKPYHGNKYRRASIDAIRLSHPKKTPIIDELMKTGKLKVQDKDLPWETLMAKYEGCWIKTMETLEWKIPHMAGLRNIRGFAIKVRNAELIQKYCDHLESGVLTGKQFPFQYLTAYDSICEATKTFSQSKTGKRYYKKAIRKQDLVIIKKCLENCIMKSIENHPKLLGNVIILSDNSGSAWNTFQSEYGCKTIAEIGNISALITGLTCTGRATIGLFGDTLLEYEVDKTKSFFENYENIKKIIGVKGQNVGLSTENGIWVFFKRAMMNPKKYRYDHLFCYSDQQAGHGGLYGDDIEMDNKWMWDNTSSYKNQRYKYINVVKLVENYRETINPKLNVFTIQTAGYNDNILPQTLERYCILSGWTGREVVFAEKMIQLWDEQSNTHQSNTHQMDEESQKDDENEKDEMFKRNIKETMKSEIWKRMRYKIIRMCNEEIENEFESEIDKLLEVKFKNEKNFILK